MGVTAADNSICSVSDSAAPVPADGARVPERHRAGGARADSRNRGATARRARGLRRRRLKLHRTLSPVPLGRVRPHGRRRGRRSGRRSGRTRGALHAGRRRTARSASGHTQLCPPGRGRADRRPNTPSPPASTTLNRPRARAPARPHRPRRVRLGHRTPRRSKPSASLSVSKASSPRSNPPTPSPTPCASRARCAHDQIILVNLSGAATRMCRLLPRLRMKRRPSI